MSSANVLEVAKFPAGLLCSCTAERINPIRGAGYRLRRFLPVLKRVSFPYILLNSCVYFHSSYFDRMRCVVFSVDVDKL